MLGLTHGQGFSEALKLTEFSHVLVAGTDEMCYIAMPENNGEEGIVVYIYEGLDTDESLEYIEDALNLPANPKELESNIESFNAFEF
jgi:hypothetical protein